MSGTPKRETNGHGRLGNILSGLAVAVGCVLFLGGFVWGAVTYQPYTVPTDSMQPTVDPGDHVLAQRVGSDQVHRGDVVVFTDPAWGDIPMVKRVVAVGGDKVSCCDKQGRLTVDGKPITEPYLDQRGPASTTHFSVHVPAGRLFMLGDNRNVSEDSRFHLTDSAGTVPAAEVKGRVQAIAWPLGRLGALARPTDFGALPGGVSTPGPLTLITWAVVVGAVLIFAGAAYGPIAGLFRRGGTTRTVAPAATVGDPRP
jgi:signal peptidase I